VRVNFVYSPPEFRGRGYATACVTALTRQLLDEGRAFCCLYADRANPTSTGIYERIGYRPIGDASDFILNSRKADTIR
jgi:predicted GNAT family acetyltransferase